MCPTTRTRFSVGDETEAPKATDSRDPVIVFVTHPKEHLARVELTVNEAMRAAAGSGEFASSAWEVAHALRNASQHRCDLHQGQAREQAAWTVTLSALLHTVNTNTQKTRHNRNNTWAEFTHWHCPDNTKHRTDFRGPK